MNNKVSPTLFPFPHNFSFPRTLSPPFKLGVPSAAVCLRCIVFVCVAIVLMLIYLRFFPYHQYQSEDKSTSEEDDHQWEVVRKKRNKDEWLKPRMECQRVFNGDKALVRQMVRRRRSMKDPDELEMNCAAIMSRHRDDDDDTTVKEDDEPSVKTMMSGRSLTELERQMPIAFARVVYMDYLFLEAELLANYAHNNWYCYVLDSKAPPVFHRRMYQLASCFDNVLVVRQMFDINSAGYNMDKATMQCVHALSDEQKAWKYLVTLQNHDVQAKTNAEMAQIFTWLRGANDVEVELRKPASRQRCEHYQNNFNWTFDMLHLFKDETMNQRTDQEGRPLELSIARGYMSVSLTREFVDFVTNKLDVTIMLEQLDERSIYGMDELFWQLLSTSESLDAPGGFPHKCFVNNDKRVYKYITRFAMWSDAPSKCLSDNWRHGVCVFGLEDLMGPDSVVRQVPHLFVNKLMQQFDYDAILCWHQWMRDRRRKQKMELDSAFYMDWPQTRYQRERALKSKAGEHAIAEVDCDTGIVRLKKRYNGTQ